MSAAMPCLIMVLFGAVGAVGKELKRGASPPPEFWPGWLVLPPYSLLLKTTGLQLPVPDRPQQRGNSLCESMPCILL